MSEQVAIQPEDFASTSNKLDSILDRLNALGASAEQLKVAPLEEVSSVPPVPPTATEDTSATVIDSVDDAAVLTPPAVPHLGLVPVLEDDDLHVPELPANKIDPTPAAAAPIEVEAPVESVEGIDTGSTDMVFPAAQPLAPIEMGDPIEAVKAIDDAEIAATEAIAAPELSVADASEAFEVPEVPAVADATEAFDVPEIPDVEAVQPTAPEVDWAVAEFDAVADISPASIGSFEPELGAPVSEAVVETPQFEAPTLEIVPDLPEMSDVEAPDLPSGALPFSSPVVDTPTEALTVVTEAESPFDETQDLFAEAPSPVEMPSEPMSIFSSGVGTDPVEPAETGPVNNGWVSHHPTPEEDPKAFLFGDNPAVEQVPAPNSPRDPWEISEPLVGSIFDQHADTAATTTTESETMASEVEQTLNDLDAFDSIEPDNELMSNDLFEPATLENFESAVVDNGDIAPDAEIYTSDEDLPLPDFTGVYDEEDGTPSGVESRIDGVSMRRAELDKLRPTDPSEDSEGIDPVELKNRRGLPPYKLLGLVLAFAIAVLVLVWLFEPAAVEDIRGGLESLIP